MQIVEKKISHEDLKKMSQKMYGKLVKAVVDIEKEIMIVDAGMHCDQESLLLESGSLQKNLWGITIHPEETGEDWIAFDSMVNLRPSFGNSSPGVDDPHIQKKIIDIVSRLVEK